MMKQMNQKPRRADRRSAAARRGHELHFRARATATTTTASGELADTDVPPAAARRRPARLVRRLRDEGSVRPQVSRAADRSPGRLRTPRRSRATTTPSASRSRVPRRVVRDDASLDRGASPTTPATTAATVDAGDAERLRRPPRPPSPPRRRSTISVNGSGSRQVGSRPGRFPTAAPSSARLLANGSAAIGIVGGSYATGGQTLTGARSSHAGDPSEHEQRRSSTGSSCVDPVKGGPRTCRYEEDAWRHTHIRRSTPQGLRSDGEISAPSPDAAREQLRIRGLLAEHARGAVVGRRRRVPRPPSRRSSRSRSRSSRASSRR